MCSKGNAGQVDVKSSECYQVCRNSGMKMSGRIFCGGLVSYVLPEDKVLHVDETDEWPGCIVGMAAPDPSSAITTHPQKGLKLYKLRSESLCESWLCLQCPR